MALTRQGISGNMCALTFDDGPSRYTARLLDTLKSYGVHATFFVVGSQVERHPELIRRMIDEGHEVGNHSYSHNALRRQSPEDQQADLRKLDTLLRELGVRPRFVRPPYGFYDHNTVNAVREMDGHMVMWSIDSQDWRKNVQLSQMQAMYKGAPLRGVFLFHDTHVLTVDRMPEIIEALASTNCRFVTLSEYIDGPHKQPAQAAAEPPVFSAGDVPTAVSASPATSNGPNAQTTRSTLSSTATQATASTVPATAVRTDIPGKQNIIPAPDAVSVERPVPATVSQIFEPLFRTFRTLRHGPIQQLGASPPRLTLAPSPSRVIPRVMPELASGTQELSGTLIRN